jgi:hypothetical protein
MYLETDNVVTKDEGAERLPSIVLRVNGIWTVSTGNDKIKFISLPTISKN